MAIGPIDLNLIKIFNAVYEDRNLLRAGKRLNLSASAVSHALTRLRHVVGDELFVRTPSGMMPTARADAMAQDLTDSLNRIVATLGVDPFSPATSTRQFVLAANDHLASVIMPHLTRLMSAEAPRIQLVVRPATRLDLAEQIDVGRIDLAMGVFQKIPEHFRSFALMTEGDLVIMHSSHPAAGRKLTLQDMVTYPLLTISVGGKEEGAVDGFILERGLARQSEMFDRNALQEALATIGAVPRYHITIAHSMVIASVMERTEMLSILPCSLARLFVATDDLLMVLPPYPVSHSTFRGIWHNRNDHDPAHLWFRKIVQRAVELMPKGVPS
ncbi:LysR family transcriptional regulator [Pseudooceanicola spongiae]|uniref:LysR family transcriptional regulator n=2 Tax=Pseudooceanicola spongiae TaxID=2613965 RepID=A0A7L9WSX7_9RHOB|nr:LysR family transcriptional regulator [Pseudooceanicola spongiae]